MSLPYLASGEVISHIERLASAVWPVIAVFALIGFLWMRSRDPKIKGPAVAGTAQVVAVKSTGTVRNRTNFYCRVALRVEIPGREPYEVTIKQYLDVTAMAAVQPGRTVSVQVDSANPQNVRIDLSGPTTP